MPILIGSKFLKILKITVPKDRLGCHYLWQNDRTIGGRRHFWHFYKRRAGCRTGKPRPGIPIQKIYPGSRYYFNYSISLKGFTT